MVPNLSQLPASMLVLLLVSIVFGATKAQYEVTFEAAWSLQTHPLQFPPGPHFSPLIGRTHHAGDTLWENGGIATPGIESMAETGATGTLRAETNAAIEAGTAFSLISGGGINPSPGARSARFGMRSTHPLVSLVSMIAPSPDWFVGVWDLPLFEGGAWEQQRVVELLAYDSGTDSGTTYGARNADITPHIPITLIEDYAFANQTPLGTFTFELISGPSHVRGDLNDDGDVNNLDVTPLIIALGIGGAVDDPKAEAAFLASVPTGSFGGADANGDGFVDNLDVTPFVVLLEEASQAGPTAAVPEPTGMGLLLATLCISAAYRRRQTAR